MRFRVMKRREFLSSAIVKTSGLALAMGSVANSSCSRKAKSKRMSLALLGCRDKAAGMAIKACNLDQNVTLKYVWDPDSARSEDAVLMVTSELGYAPEVGDDMKEILSDPELDAVIVAAPEHWLALATVRACRAGKDVYLDGGTGLSIWEGRTIVQAAEKYRVIVQVGFPSRSAGCSSSARDFIKGGGLGQVVHVKTYAMSGGDGDSFAAVVPDSPGLNWDTWLGPASERPYEPGIINSSGGGSWPKMWDFGGGILFSRGTRVMDLARMVLGDPEHPVSVYCLGEIRSGEPGRETPDFQVITYNYGDFNLTMECGNQTRYLKTTPASIRESDSLFPDWRTNGYRVEIYGTGGLMYLGCDGDGWQAYGSGGEIIGQEAGRPAKEKHLRNFLDCVRSRKKPVADPEKGHMSSTLVHLGNISCRMGNKHLVFDGRTESFRNNEANRFLRNSYRENYSMPDVT